MSPIDNNVNSIPKLLDDIANYNTLNSRTNSEKLYKLATESNITVLPKEDIDAIEKKITKFELEYLLNKDKKGANYFPEIMNNLQNSRNKQYDKEGLFRGSLELKKLSKEIYSDEKISENISTYVEEIKSLNLSQKYINDADTLRVITAYVKSKVDIKDYKLVKKINSKYIKEIYSEKKLRENISDDKIPGKTFVKKPEIKTENLAGKKLSKEKKQPLEKKVEQKENKLSYEQIISQKPQSGGRKKETNESIANKNRLSDYEAKKAKYAQEKATKDKNNLKNKKEAYSIKTELIKDKKKKEWNINKKLESINKYLTKKIDLQLKNLFPKIPSNYVSDKLKPILDQGFNLSKYKPQPLYLNIPKNFPNIKISKKGMLTLLTAGVVGTAGILYAFNTPEKILPEESLETSVQIPKNKGIQNQNNLAEAIDPKLTKNYFEEFPVAQKDTAKTDYSEYKDTNMKAESKVQERKSVKIKKLSKENYFKKTENSNHFRNSKVKTHFRKRK